MTTERKRIIKEGGDIFVNSDLIIADILNKVSLNEMLKKLRTARHRDDY